MARFVTCDDGWVNLDHVALVRDERTSNPPRLRFEAPDGSPLAYWSNPAEDPEEFTASVVPAASGATAIIISPDWSTARERPSEVHVETVLIAAWRVTRDYQGFIALPVLVESPAADGKLFVVMPDGKLTAPSDYCTYDDLRAACADMLTEFQAAWDDRHAKPSGA